MAKSAKLVEKCPQCNKVAVESGRKTLPGPRNLTVIDLHCGHKVFKFGLKRIDFTEHKSYDEKSPYPFQSEGMKFLEDNDFRGLIADEMGLGKTIQAVVPLAYHEELRPALFLVKTGLKIQFFNEILRWANLPSFIIEDPKFIPPRAPVMICSLDLLRNIDLEELEKLKIKYLVVDECQNIKNPQAKRTQCVRRLAKDVPHVVGLSGTPIKNRGSEYFTILNLIAPARFPTLEGFRARYVKTYFDWNSGTTKEGGVYLEKFRDATEDIVIRRERSEVLPDLPKVSRHSLIVDIAEKARETYDDLSDEFTQVYNKAMLEGKNDFETQTNLLAILARMRHITGLSKVKEVIDFVTDHLFSTNRKIVVFAHHQDVQNLIFKGISTWCKNGNFPEPQRFASEMDGKTRNNQIESFLGQNGRVLVASTQAAGEGLNLQACSDMIMVERQWNPANEAQCEARFTRPGSTADKVTATYILAVNTIDEWITELIEKKRAIMDQVLDGRESNWDEASIISDLTKVINSKRQGQKFKF